MLHSIAYLATIASALLVQSSDARVLTVAVEKVQTNTLGNQEASARDGCFTDSDSETRSNTNSNTHSISLKNSVVPKAGVIQSVFTGDVQIGTPPQPFKMVFSTASMVIWAPNKKVGNHAVYDSSKSSTYVKNGTYYQVIYGAAGMVSGVVTEETIHFGGYTFPNQKIMEASNTSLFENYENLPFDGIFGLGLDVENPYMLPNPVQKLAMDGKLDKPQFAFYLGNNGPAELTLGGVNPSRFTGDIHYVDVVFTGAWWIETQSVTIGSKTLSSNTVYAQFTAESSFAAAPPSQFEAIVNATGGKQGPDSFWVIDCGSTGPTLTFTIGGQKYSLEKADYTYKKSDGTCVLAIGESPDEFWGIGDIFLQKYYTVFEFPTKKDAVPRVGFAKAA